MTREEKLELIGKLDRSWINKLGSYVLRDKDSLKMFPLQFANCDRLAVNDCVFIFDEVGSGKTISSGLMALDYLCNHPQERVLVITTNSLVKKGTEGADEWTCKYGQFKGKWFRYLPFEELRYQDRVEVINNNWSIIKKISTEKYGLIIIDEAHVFLNMDAKRTRYLKKMQCSPNKMVFMTATPIKEMWPDLYKYIDIAVALMGKEKEEKIWSEASWMEKILKRVTNKDASIENVREALLYDSFDPLHPISRYFKDTIRCLEAKEEGVEYNKHVAKRQPAELWWCEEREGKQESKYETLVRKILKIRGTEIEEQQPDRFIVFTRLKEDSTSEKNRMHGEMGTGVYLEDGSAKNLGAYLAGVKDENGNVLFKEFVKNESCIESRVLTYKVVTGDAPEELQAFTELEGNLPDVLIITYQIAEQGVDLPGYNYVVNYHISAFPSALEQRFGRVDRLNSKHEKIHMCYLLSKAVNGRNEENLWMAVCLYLHELIPYYPTKNAILSEEIFENYYKSGMQRAYEKEIERLIKDKEKMQTFLKSAHMERTEREEVYNFLWQLCEEQNLEIEEEQEVEVVQQKLKQCFLGFKVNMEQEISKKYHQIILEDKVFYALGSKELLSEPQVLGSAIEFAERICETDTYKEYTNIFNRKVRFLFVYQKYQKYISMYFEKVFMDNDFYTLCDVDSYPKVFEEMLQSETFKELKTEEKDILIEQCRYCVENLPIMKLLFQYQDILIKLRGGQYAWQYQMVFDKVERYDFNPFTRALLIVGNLLRSNNSVKWLGCSKEDFSQVFLERYFGDEVFAEGSKVEERLANFFYIMYDEEQHQLQASNWYKWAFIWTNRFTVNYRSLFRDYIITEGGRVRNRILDVNGKKEGDYIYDEHGFISVRPGSIGYFGNKKLRGAKADKWTAEMCKVLSKILPNERGSEMSLNIIHNKPE